MAAKVLVIDDSMNDAKMVENLLRAEKIETAFVTSGEEGIKKAQEMIPDLIVLDLILPDISGFDVCSRIKSDPKLKNTIVVVLSIKDSVADITRAFQLGADDYMVKPSVPEFIIRKIKLYLGIRS